MPAALVAAAITFDQEQAKVYQKRTSQRRRQVYRHNQSPKTYLNIKSLPQNVNGCR